MFNVFGLENAGLGHVADNGSLDFTIKFLTFKVYYSVYYKEIFSQPASFNLIAHFIMNPIFVLLILAACKTLPQSPPEDNSTTQAIFRNVTSTHLNSDKLSDNSMDGEAIDIDRDEDMDMILAMEFRRNRILINDGTGKLVDETEQRFPNASHDSEDIALADFDGDGDIDLVFVSEDDQQNEYYVNNGQGVFSDESNKIPVSGTSNAVEEADVNMDGAMDLIIGNQGQNVLLINDGKGNFTNETAIRLPSNTATTQDIDLADVDQDGDLDIIEANETHNRLLINDGQGVFTDETQLRLPDVNDQTREVDLADIGNDGDLDIFFANVDFGGVGNPQNRLLLNDGKGHFTEATEPALPASNFRTVDADFFDINQDGYMDIISGNRFNGMEMLVLLNDGEGRFSDQTKTYFPTLDSYVFDFQFADFDGDGQEDIYFCNFRGGDILLFRQK